MTDNTPRIKPLTWHEIDQRGLQVAGNTAGVSKLCGLYCDYPDLHVSVVDRLKYFNFAASTVGQQSSVFGIDYGSAVMDARNGMFKDLPPESYKREGIADKMQNMLLERIDLGRGMSTFYQTKWHGGGRNLNQLVFGASDVQTRTEIMAGLAGISPHRFNMPNDVSLADVHRYVFVHELQHSRNASTYKLNDDFYNSRTKSELEKDFTCYRRLQPRFEGDDPIKRAKVRGTDLSDDLYAGYIDETICDTAAVLHHIKAGGSFSHVRNLADARAAGFVMKGNGSLQSFKYGMHSVLDKVVENEERAKEIVKNIPEEQLDQVAVYWVAELGWSRTEFFQQTNSARMANRAILCQSEGHDNEESYQKAKADVATISEEYSARKKDRERIAPTEERVRQHIERTSKAMKTLLRQTPERPTEHLIEVKAMLAYNQARRPEFAGPEGEKHLLAMRARFIATEKLVSPHEEKVMTALQRRADYMANLETDVRLQPIPDKEPPQAPENSQENAQENDFGRA